MAAGMLFFFMIVIKHAIRTAGGNTVELEFQITLAERTNVAHAWCGHEPAGRLPRWRRRGGACSRGSCHAVKIVSLEIKHGKRTARGRPRPIATDRGRRVRDLDPKGKL